MAAEHDAVVRAAKQVWFRMRDPKYPLTLYSPELVWLRKAVEALNAAEPHKWQGYSDFVLEATNISPGTCVVCGVHALNHPTLTGRKPERSTDA